MHLVLGLIASLVAFQAEPQAPAGTAPAVSQAVEDDTTSAAAAALRAEVELARQEAGTKARDAALQRLESALDKALACPGRPRSAKLHRELQGLATLALELRAERLAVKALEPCLTFALAELGETHDYVLALHTQLGTANLGVVDLDASERHLEAALALAERLYEPDDERLCDARSNLSIVRFRKQDYLGAAELLRPVVALLSKRHGARAPQIQWACANLANALDALGDFDTARELREQVHDVLSAERPEDSSDLWIARENLALSLRKTGDVEGARLLLARVLAEKERKYPGGHVSLDRTRLNLGVALTSIGELEAASLYLEAAHAGQLARSGPDDPLVMTALRLRSQLMFRLGNQAEALALDRVLVEQRERLHGADHRLVLEARSQLARHKIEAGQLEQGLVELERVVAGMRKQFAEDNIDRLQVEAWLAGAWAQAGKNREAAELFEDVHRRWSSRPEDNRMDLLLLRANQACALESHDGTGALALLRELGPKISVQLAEPVALTTPRESESRGARFASLIDMWLSRCRTPQDAAAGLELVERARATAWIAARHQRDLERASSAEPQVVRLQGALRTVGARLESLAEAGEREAYRSAALERAKLEQELATALAPFGSASARPPATVAQLAGTLQPGEIAVALRRISAPLDATDTKQVETYVAFVLARDGAVRRVDLGEAATLESEIERWREAVLANPGQPAALRELGLALRKRLVDPLLAGTADLRRVVIAPDAALYLVPFDALPQEDGVVGDVVEFEQREFLGERLSETPRTRGLGPALLVGDITYAPAATNGSESTPQLLRRRASVRPARFAPLPASAFELESLAAVFLDPEDEDALVVLRGDSATKAALVEHCSGAQWVHIASHGYASTARANELALDPFSREIRGLSPRVLCGLALAGADAPQSATDRSQGILSGEELCYLDLSKCRLATLSACDTSVGVQRAGLGIASLQSSLRIAGARSTLTSLWKVDDAATAELMKSFYRFILDEGETPAGALRKAKKALRERRAPPRDWAGWVLTGPGD